jgi:succinate dehydrogenase / fumarate reductase membrane anchor subunit
MKNFVVKKSKNTGGAHWIAERVTAIAAVFFTIWLAYSLLAIATGNIANARIWLSSPFHAVVMVLFLANTFYHSAMGLQVVIEDYVHCNCAKVGLLLANKFACIAAAATGIFAVFHIYASVNFVS